MKLHYTQYITILHEFLLLSTGERQYNLSGNTDNVKYYLYQEIFLKSRCLISFSSTI